jgi:uncharacterized protein
VNTKRMLGVGSLAIVAVAVLGLMLALFSRNAATPVAQAQVTPPPNGYSGISVNGTGIISVQPDVVRMTIGVQEQAATVAAAQTAANDKAKKITDALKAAGVKAEDIKTANYGVAPQYRYDNNQPPTLVGYVVSSQYAITVRDITKAGSTIDAATAAGANSIYGITFTLDDNAKALEQARTAAMDDAAKTAGQLAAGGKVQVGSVIRVVEQSQNVSPKSMPVAMEGRAGVAASAAPTNIEPGMFQVIVNVEVTYAVK